jgi:acyl carrier protein
MSLYTFINNFQNQLEGSQEIVAKTEFKKLKSWDSMTALLVITMIDDEYGVGVSGDDIRKVETVGELYELVLARVSFTNDAITKSK